MRGYSQRGRTARADLTEDAVKRIRALAQRGVPTRQLADEFGVGLETIRRIVRWDTWRWVGEASGEELGLVTPTFTDAEIEASKQRLLAKLGLASPRPQGNSGTSGPDVSVATQGTVPSLEDALKAQALRDAAEQGTGLERLQREAGRPAELLAELERGETDGGGK